METIIPIVLIGFTFLYLLYPVFVYVRFLILKKKILRSESFLEPVSIIIACYNEEKYIEDKILSYINETEWIEGSEIIVISSGCTDNTNLILDRFNLNNKLIVIKPEKRMSKIDSVNLAVSHSKHQLLVFSDCRQKMKPNSVKNLIYNFNDPNVGTVAASLEDFNIENKKPISRKILNFINYHDGQTGSCLNVYGALYAQRKSVFLNFPNNILFDDLFVVCSTLSQGKWLVQEKNAVIFDVFFDSYYSNERIERLARGLLLFFFRQRKFIKHMDSSIRLRFIFYKYVKLILPFLLLFLLGYFIRFVYSKADLRLNLSLFTMLLGVFCVKKIRDLLILITRINLNFILATMKFIFLNKRSIYWEKIKPDEKIISQ